MSFAVLREYLVLPLGGLIAPVRVVHAVTRVNVVLRYEQTW